MKMTNRQKMSVCVALQAMLVFCPVSFAQAASTDAEKYAKPLRAATSEFERGNYEVAQNAFLKLVTKYPSSGELRTMLAKSYKRLGKMDEAKGEFRAAIQVEPNCSDAYYELGCLLEGDKEWISAAVAFEKYLELKPDASQRKTIMDRIKFCRNQ